MAVAHSMAAMPSGGRRIWTVIGQAYRTVEPVEEWLEAHRYLWSPNGCAVAGAATGEWVGNLRDRLLFALLAETGIRLVRCWACGSAIRDGPRPDSLC